MDDELYRATVAVLKSAGWDGLTLERVAEQVGRSRVTLWRKGVTRDSLLEGLLRRLAQDYRDAMLPVLTAAGPPRERLRLAMEALCDVADAHADLLAVSDEMFHRASEIGDIPLRFLDPFLGPIRESRAAGAIRGQGSDIDIADVLFNATAWPYLHFTARHGWSARKARDLLLPTLIDGTLA